MHQEVHTGRYQKKNTIQHEEINCCHSGDSFHDHFKDTFPLNEGKKEKHCHVESCSETSG